MFTDCDILRTTELGVSELNCVCLNIVLVSNLIVSLEFEGLT